MSAAGYPDYQRITQWFGAPLAQATAFAIGAGLKVEGPFEATNFASIVVCVKPTGGNVTVTVIQSIPGGPPALSVQTSFVVNDGNTIFEAFVLEAGSVEVHFQGAAGGETITYAIVPANTNTNAEVAALTQLGFQHNDLLAANETAIDLEDSGQFVWTLTDDPANLRMKVALALAANGAATGSLYRYTGAAWAPTAGIIADDTARKFTFGGDTTLYRSAAAMLKTDGELTIAGADGNGVALYLSTGFLDITRALAGQLAVQARVAGDTNQRWSVDDNGTQAWGAGNVATDTNLYRSAAAILRTDGDLWTGGKVLALGAATYVGGAYGNAGQSLLGAVGPASQAGVSLGSASDLTLYRVGAHQAVILGDLFAGDSANQGYAFFARNADVGGRTCFAARVNADTVDRWLVKATGDQQLGPGGATAVDTLISRFAAGQVKLSKIGGVGPHLGDNGAGAPVLYFDDAQTAYIYWDGTHIQAHSNGVTVQLV